MIWLLPLSATLALWSWAAYRILDPNKSWDYSTVFTTACYLGTAACCTSILWNAYFLLHMIGMPR